MTEVDRRLDRRAPAPAPAGAAEEAFYFESAGRRLFATLHAPPAGAARGGGWLFCAPFGEERGFAQRTMVEWARALAAAGHWVLRFDYRGYGDSEGWFEEFTAEDHLADILQARHELERRAGVPCRGLWGLRLGASLAALAAARADLPVALALWDPVVSGERYMETLLRAAMVKEMANTARAPRTRAQLKEHLAAGGTVVTEGHALTDALFRSVAGIDLTALPASPARPTMVVQLSARAEAQPRPDLEALRRTLGARLEVVRAPPPWQQNDEYAAGRDAPFAPTLRWIEELAPPAPVARASPVPLVRQDRELHPAEGGVERAVEVPAGAGVLRAILHLPRDPDPARPAVVMVTPGFNCRTARYRLYVKLARALAQRGVIALRVDPHGIGDSDGTLDHPMVPDLYNAIEQGMFVEDTKAALDHLEAELGIGSALLVGLCGGATTSVRLAAEDGRVAGIVASELPFVFTPNEAAEQARGPAPVARAAADHFLRSYVRKLMDPEAWRRFFTFQSDYRSLGTSLRVALAKRLWPGRIRDDEAWYRERLGPLANLGLVARFQGCLRRRIPVLCLFGATRNSWYFSEIWPALERAAPGAAERVRTRNIQDADPGFSLPAHTAEFLDVVLAWIDEFGGSRQDGPVRAARAG